MIKNTHLNIWFYFSFILLSSAGLQAQYAEPILFDAQNSSGELIGSKGSTTTHAPNSSIQSVSGTASVVKDRGNSSNRVDIVFLGDGYLGSELSDYANQVSEYSTSFITQEPFFEYQEYFNIHRVDTASKDSGVDNDIALGFLKDTVFDSQFWCQGNQTTLCTDVSKAWSAATLARDFDQIVVLVNSNSSGSASYPFSDLSVLSAKQNQKIDNLLHLLGHSFGNLADEYDTGSWPTYTGFEPAESNVSAQNAAAMTLQSIKWVKWLGVSAFGSTIDTFEGAMGHQQGIYRPTLTSKMRELNKPFNAPSVESIIKEIYRHVRPIDDATSPALNGQGVYTGQNTFFVKPMKTNSDFLKVQWSIDGKEIPGAVNTTFRPNNYPITSGTRKISVKVVDKTPWLKDENFRAKSMSDERSWDVLIDQKLPIIAQHPSSQTRFPNQSAEFKVSALGEDLSYQWYKNGNKITNATGTSITVSPISRQNDKDEYWVVVSNIAGSVRSNTANLFVGNRLPTYSGQDKITTFRNVQSGFTFNLSDLDNDLLTVKAELDSVGKLSGAEVLVSNSQLDLKTGAGFLGSYNIDLKISDGISEIKVPIQVTVNNRAPSLALIQNQTVNWSEDFIVIDLDGSDLDPMDSLTYSALADAGVSNTVQISVDGRKLKINPASGYVGQFAVTARVTDGMLSASRSFVVTWSNSAPTVSPIANQRMFYKNDKLQVGIAASDPNNDKLTLSAKVIQGGSLQLSFDNNNLIIDPPVLTQGVYQIEVSASDGKMSSARQFIFESYNTAPAISAISDQRIGLQKKSLTIPISVSDADGDELSVAANIVTSLNQQIGVQASKSEIILTSSSPFNKDFSVNVSVSDGNKSANTNFNVKINNIPPELTFIEDQYLQPMLEDQRVVTLKATDADNDSLTYKASHVAAKNADIASISISGNMLTVNPVDKYLGSFPVLVEVSDGTATDTQVFTVNTYNNAPTISKICNKVIPVSEFPAKIPFLAKDIDSENLTYEVLIESSNVAHDLDLKYNFAPVLGDLGYNVFGQNEKYLTATVKNKENTLVFITADNKLYEAGESFEKSVYLEDVNSLFYANPLLLVNAGKDVAPGINANVENGEIKVNRLSNFSGLAVLRLRAKDSFTFAEESFILGVGSEGFDIGIIPDIRSHWREDKAEVIIPVLGKSSDFSKIKVNFYQSQVALELDRQYQFSYLMSDDPNPIHGAERPADNKDGLQEKYFIGLDTVVDSGTGRFASSAKVYSITPSGTVRRYQREIHGANDMYQLNKASVVGKVAPIFYKHLPLLLEPPSNNEPNIKLTLSGNNLIIDTEDQFIGKAVFEISSGNEYLGSQLVLFDRYNTRPVHSGIKGGTYSYRTKPIVIPVSSSDSDSLDKSNVNKEYFIEVVPYSRFDSYDLIPDFPLAKRYNEDGWREIRLVGKFDNKSSEFAILPSGALYANWNGSPHTSSYVTHADYQAYIDSSYLDGRTWVGDYTKESPLRDTKLELKNNQLVVTLPENYKEQMGSFMIHARAVDGLSVSDVYDRFIFWNSQTITDPISPLAVHWRTLGTQINLNSVDADGAEDIKPELSVFSFPINNGIPGRLGISGTPYLLNLNLALGVPRTFDFSVRISDMLDHGSTRDVKLSVLNNLPSIEMVNAHNFSYTSPLNQVNFSVNDLDSADKDKLRSYVIPGTISSNVGNVVSKYNLKNNSTIPYNTAGSFEKHLTGQLNGKNQEFILLQNGALYAWNGSFDPSLLVDFLPSVAWGNTDLYLSKQPTPQGLAKAEISGNSIKFERNGAAMQPATHTFTVIASDGVEYVSSPVYVSWKDHAPTLVPNSSVSGHWRNGALSISGFPTTDVDGDPIVYTLSGSNNPGYVSEIVNGVLKVTPKANSALTHVVSVKAKSTSHEVNGSYTFNFTNQAPIFQDSSTLSLGYKETVTITPNVTDPDSDPLILSASLSGASASGYKVSIVSNSVIIEPVKPVPGEVKVKVNASDTIASAVNEYTINYINRAPEFKKIPSIKMKWSDKSKSEEILVTDPDNDSITYTTSVAGNIANAQVQNSNLIVSLVSFASNFDVKVTASDGTNKINGTASVSVSNASPVLSGLPSSKKVHWTTESFSIPLSGTDSDGDALIYDAKVLGSQLSASASVSNNVLTILLPEKKVGSFKVETGISDGVLRIPSIMQVEVTNGAPKIGELSNIFFTSSSESKNVDTESSDPDSDPLTLTAKILTAEQVGYELDSIFNFTIGSPNFNFNKLGNAEKYIRGRKPRDTVDSEFVIYPNGRMYIWTGMLSTSTYLGTIPAMYYQDPSRLVNANPVSSNISDITASISGTKIQFETNSNFVGTAWVYASVTDTKDSTGVFFSVTKDNDENPDDQAQCKILKEEYDGEYSSNGSAIFVAEGRIGDSLSGAGNRTFELDISKSTSGPFASGETSNYVWQNNKKVNFSITYDPDTEYANFTVDGVSVRHKVINPKSPSDLIVRVRRANDNSSMLISDLNINGTNTGYKILANPNTGQVKTLRVRAVKEFSKKFTVSGSATMGFSGSAKNSEVAFQMSFVKMSDAPSSCNGESDDDEDDDDGEDTGNGKKVTICHIPGGDFSKAKTLSIGKSALPAHLAHGDIIGACPGQPNDPGDPNTGGPSCEHKQVITSPNYTFWNSFLNMMNILELVNGTNKDIVVKVNFYSISGALFDQRLINVPANNQFDLIVNDLNNFIKDSYGIIKLEFEGNLDGRMSFYRPSADKTGYDYAFTVPLIDATFGTTAVSFNTYQPSFKPEEFNNQVANWLSIVNLDSELRTFTVLTYDTPGRLIMRREVDVPSFGRMDIDGGHGIVGPNVVGYHKIIPKNVTGEYITQLIRYGGDAPAGFAPSKFKFAVPLSSKLGQSDPQYMPISNKFGETNWIEVINILDKSVGASINYYSSAGILLESVDAQLNANSQMHFEASRRLPSNEVGYAVVVPYEPFSIVAQSMGYLREKVGGSVTAVYGTQSRRIVPCMQAGSYNLYLNMQNWLLVANPTNDTVQATVSFSTSSSQSEKTIVLTPKSAMHIPIHDNAELKTKPDTYGLISVYPKDSSVRLFSEVLRLRHRANGNPDFAMSVPIR